MFGSRIAGDVDRARHGGGGGDQSSGGRRPERGEGAGPFGVGAGKARALRRAYGGDKALKRVFFQSAFCAVSIKDPTSKAFYDRKRRGGQRHVQAFALARRRVTVVWAMLSHRQPFNPAHRAA